MSKFGILAPVSCLPSKDGIGDFGYSSFSFIEFLKRNNFSYWQILPLNPLGEGNSPYMSSCSNAIDIRYISIDLLAKKGLINKTPYPYKNSNYINYDEVYSFKIKCLKIAYENFKATGKKELDKFKDKNYWCIKYAIFEYFREKNNYVDWSKWPDNEINYNVYKGFPKGSEDYCNFICFCQMLAKEQWLNVLSYAHKNKIKIISDCPFYVGYNSVDCWANKKLFLLDENYNPTLVSGCPPDYFSKDGQVWGTPIYNFDIMKCDNYTFLVSRIGYLNSISDYLRLDHFRAFDTYFAIPFGEKTAVNGTWKVGPRNSFFDNLFVKYPKCNIIAEDLGLLFDSVYELKNHYNFPGMYVNQFKLLEDNAFPSNNDIVYIGTHDNDTLSGWIKSLTKKEKSNLKRKFTGKDFAKDVFNFVKKQNSKITIFTLQDLYLLPSKTRFNTPGTQGSPNWEFKFLKLKSLKLSIKNSINCYKN